MVPHPDATLRSLLLNRHRQARTGRAMLAGLLSGALVGGLLVSLPAQAKPAPKHLSAQVEKLDRDGGPVRFKAWPYSPQRQVPAPAPVWPTPGQARVTLPPDGSDSAKPVRAGELPVSIARADGAAGARVSDVTVRILDRASAPAGWRDGLLLRLGSPQDPLAVGTVQLSVDYRGFRYAYGGDWASRLRLWQLPECALTTPGVAGCSARPLVSKNNSAVGVVSAQVPVVPIDSTSTATRTQPIDGSAAASEGTLVALAADASGSAGTFGATTLAPSALWSSGGSSGDFSWSYPMRTPPAIDGNGPEISVAYSSSSVDGRSEATNNQPSWLGEGFDYWPGYIERSYVPCMDDMGNGAVNTIKTGDLCWRSDNAVMNLAGGGSELVYESGKGWHARNENAAKIEKLTGAANGDDNGEYWKVTTSDGTQYFFGRHSLPGQSSVTNSTWTVPVAGNHPASGGKPAEPCYSTSFTGSFCNQAWRWNLDYVVDVRGNTTSYWYAKESNKYARNLTDTDEVSYDRGGYLTRIDYGTWDRSSTDRSVNPTAQVQFTSADRCVTSSCGTHDATNWPDTPWDQECTGTSCPGKYVPTFWTAKRLSKITTQVWDTTKPTPAWQPVDSWTFTHSFPPLGDGSTHAGLWLDKIVHAGHVGTALTMPPVTFTPVALPNRVLTMNTSTNNWQRIDYIITETGARIDLEWELPECTESNLPSAAYANTLRCYPVMVDDPDDPTGQRVIPEWWHKHRVKSISESDLPTDATGHQAPPRFTYYEYVGGPAWHYADDDGLTQPKRKTWGQFRGYASVKTRVGDVPGSQTLTVTNYMRGMHGDRSSPSGGTRTVTVPASLGSETVYDEDQFADMVREEVVYNGSESKPVSKTVNVPWMSPATASRTINGDTVTARFTQTKISYEATALGVDGAHGWRTTRSESWFSDTYGTMDKSQEDGETGKPGDEKCTTYSYNRNLSKNLVTTVKQTTTTALTCGTAPTSTDHIISDARNYYDGATSVDTAPVYGSVTKVESLKDWTATNGTVWQTTSQATFDAYGRTLTSTDIKGNTTQTAYTPSTGGPVTRVTTTEGPFNWVTTTDNDPYSGSVTHITDRNGGVIDVSYDGLGRVWRVWNIGWAKSDHGSSPSAEYTYAFAPNRDAYPYATAKSLNAGGGYRTSYQILDSLLRPRQTQTAGVGGGVIVSDIIYDKLGRAATTYNPHVEPGTPSGTLWWEPEWSVPAVAKTVYDSANRATANIFLAGNGVDNLVEKWRTTTAYEGDLTKTTPRAGDTSTTKVTDAQGRVVELRQHTTVSGVAGAYQSTWYTYNGKDQLTKVVDPAGNQWTYKYDVKGRQYEAVDPDKGTTTSQYNDYDEVEKTTDARGEVLWYVYDALGRKTELRDDSATGPLRAKWKYDKLYTGSTSRAKGQLTEAYRYEPPGSTNIYKWQVGGFDARYQPSNVNYIVPDVPEMTGLSGTWSFGYGYSDYDGSPTSVLYPEGGGLTNETVTTVYDATTGLPTELDTSAVNVFTYVVGQQYTAFGEPTLTTRKVAGGYYVEDTNYYDESTRRITRSVIQPETATGTVSDRNYTYDAAGSITSIADTPQVGAADTQCFRSDALRQLTSAWTPKAGVNCGTDPSVANLGGPAPYWLDWTIDAVGSRTKEVSHTAGGDTERLYTVPTGGAGVVRPHAVTEVTTKTPGQADVVNKYGYDNAGNTTCRPTSTAVNTCPPGGSSQTLSWDAEGRLSTVSAGGSAIETNIYGADGTRWIRRDATGATLYLGDQEIRRDNSSIVTGTRYYTFGDKLVGSRNPNGLTWLYTDHQGTQHTAVNAGTQAVTVRRQTPYGQSRGGSSTWSNQRGFVGGDTDPSGLTHIGARDYDPTLGRFVSVDPIIDFSDPLQMHGYAYAHSSPVTFSDPSGLLDCGNDDCSQYSKPTSDGGEIIHNSDGTTEKIDKNGKTVSSCDKKCVADKKNKNSSKSKDKGKDKDEDKKEDSAFKQRVAKAAKGLTWVADILGLAPGWLCPWCAGAALVVGAAVAILYLVAGKIGKAIAAIIGVGLGALAGAGAKKILDTLVSRYWVKALQLTSHLRGKQGRRILARALTRTYAAKVDTALAAVQGIMGKVYSDITDAITE
jgi:RHS repeat-associated protein